MDASVEVIHHPFHIAIESGDLLGCLRRPKYRIEAAVCIMQRPRLGSDRIGHLAGSGCVHGIAIQQLHLNVDAVLHQGIYRILQLLRA